MKKKIAKKLNEKSDVSDYGRHSLNGDDEVLNLGELFDVQGGVDNTDEKDHLEETCGLGCYGGRNIVIKKGNGQQ